MNTIATIRIDHFRAVSQFSGVKDIRYYLNGVLVEVGPGTVRLCATDGHALALTHTACEEAKAPAQVIIPSETVKAIIKAAGKATHAVLSAPEDVYLVDDDATKPPHKLYVNGATFEFSPIDGRFPDYLRFIPKDYDGKAAYFNPKLLSRFQKAAAVYGSRNNFVELAYNGDQAALVRLPIEPEFCGIVMPWRVGNAATLPEWLAEPEASEHVA